MKDFGPCLCGDPSCPLCFPGCQEEREPVPGEVCPECEGAGLYSVDPAGFGEWKPIVCPTCYGFGRVLSPEERAICLLLREAPEWARAVAAPGYDADDEEEGPWAVLVALPLGVTGPTEHTEVKWEPDSGRWWTPTYRTQRLEGRAPSLAEAVCQALGLAEGATDD